MFGQQTQETTTTRSSILCIVGSMGVAKQQSDLKRSFLQIYQIDLSIFVDRWE